MTAINFPDSPSNGDTHVVGGVTYTYDSTETKWKTTINSNAFLPLSGGTVSGTLTVNDYLAVNGNVQFGDGGGFDMNANGTRWQFSLAGTERMRLDSSGRLGLGSNNPAANLHVKGNDIIH